MKKDYIKPEVETLEINETARSHGHGGKPPMPGEGPNGGGHDSGDCGSVES